MPSPGTTLPPTIMEADKRVWDDNFAFEGSPAVHFHDCRNEAKKFPVKAGSAPDLEVPNLVPCIFLVLKGKQVQNPETPFGGSTKKQHPQLARSRPLSFCPYWAAGPGKLGVSLAAYRRSSALGGPKLICKMTIGSFLERKPQGKPPILRVPPAKKKTTQPSLAVIRSLWRSAATTC